MSVGVAKDSLLVQAFDYQLPGFVGFDELEETLQDSLLKYMAEPTTSEEEAMDYVEPGAKRRRTSLYVPATETSTTELVPSRVSVLDSDYQSSGSFGFDELDEPLQDGLLKYMAEPTTSEDEKAMAYVEPGAKRRRTSLYVPATETSTTELMPFRVSILASDLNKLFLNFFYNKKNLFATTTLRKSTFMPSASPIEMRTSFGESVVEREKSVFQLFASLANIVFGYSWADLNSSFKKREVRPFILVAKFFEGCPFYFSYGQAFSPSFLVSSWINDKKNQIRERIQLFSNKNAMISETLRVISLIKNNETKYKRQRNHYDIMSVLRIIGVFEGEKSPFSYTTKTLDKFWERTEFRDRVFREIRGNKGCGIFFLTKKVIFYIKDNRVFSCKEIEIQLRKEKKRPYGKGLLRRINSIIMILRTIELVKRQHRSRYIFNENWSVKTIDEIFGARIFLVKS